MKSLFKGNVGIKANKKANQVANKSTNLGNLLMDKSGLITAILLKLQGYEKNAAPITKGCVKGE